MKTVPISPRTGPRAGIILGLIAMPALALAAEGSADKDIPRLGLSPGEPQVRSATPTVPFGMKPANSKENSLDFHGYLLLPASMGIHERKSTDGQTGLVTHTPALMAQDLRKFEYTGAVPTPWIQLNLSYGNSTVYGTAILVGTSASDGAGYFNPVEQMGVNDAFITANLTKSVGFPLELKVGALTGRYGAMGSYDAGRYATPLIARTNTVGETATTGLKLGEVMILVEQGLGGQFGRPPVGMAAAGWNDYATADVGATFVNQLHVGAAYAGLARLGLHYVNAWTRDDFVTGGKMPDGSITVLGVDLNLTAGRAGHLYAGFAHTTAHDADKVSGAIEILNARGGPELVRNYLGPKSGGNGKLSTLGAQYDLSVARLVYGDLYTGDSPDVLVSLFGVRTSVSSDDSDYDGVSKLKGGAEATYLPLSWFGVSERFDHVRLHGSDSKQAFTIYSSRLLFHLGWKSRGEFALQYSHFVYGSHVPVTSSYSPALAVPVNPDHDVFSLLGTYWW